MTKTKSILFGLTIPTLFAGTAVAGSPIIGPNYIGDRSTNAEEETYAYWAPTDREQLVAFVGPARYVGPVTGNAEKDTIGYRPLLGFHANGLWSFQLTER